MVVTFRVYKKVSPNGKITVYLPKRDYVDHIKFVDPIDGVLVTDDEYLKNRKVFGQIVATFRYGREEDEVMGLHFYKELYLASQMVYPSSEEDREPGRQDTRMQQRLVAKLGPNAYPFRLQIPAGAPQSVTIQPVSKEHGAPCGIHYDVKLFIGESQEDRSHKRSTIRMGIRKIQWAQIKHSRQPCSVIRKDFLLSPGEMELETTLDKQVYQPGEDLIVNVTVRNYSNKTIKSIRINAVQNIDICMFASGHYHVNIAKLESDEGCPVLPGASIQKSFTITPSTDYKSNHRGVALDGQLKNEDTSLASSTLIEDQDQKELFGIIVSYSIKVKLCLGALAGEVVSEMPFILMRPRPKRGPVQLDSQDVDLGVEQFKSSRDNTIDLEDPSDTAGNKVVFEDFSQLRLDRSSAIKEAE